MKVYLAEDYHPSEDEPYMNPKQLEYFRRRLLLWRDELAKESAELSDQLKIKSAKKREVGDQGRSEADKAMILEASHRNRNLIYNIDEALERIRHGTYGLCAETGEEIGIRRLEAQPIATLSIEAQKRHEEKQRRAGYRR